MYVVPVRNAYHVGFIGPLERGSEVKMMCKNPDVCFQIDSRCMGTYEEIASEILDKTSRLEKVRLL
jgi:hypothetical protein